MAKTELFKSLSSVIGQAQADMDLSLEQVKLSLAFSFNQFRDKQIALHFETSKESLGPGHLVSYDLERQTVEIQLRGDNRILEFTFNQINDFGPAKYESPETMGETLIGAFWEAKITRRYLERIVANSYARLSPEEIDSFEKITNVSQVEIADLVPLELLEDEVKQHICDIIGHPFVQKDWGGETCDLFCNLRFRRRSVPAAFVLKGKSYSHRPLRIADLGKNGDQLVRLFSLPVEIFIVQSNGPIDGAVYSQVQAQVAEKLMMNQPVYYLVLDGLETARLLRAYGKI
jgi:hypothetical protein